jgi:hypothetical protein
MRFTSMMSALFFAKGVVETGEKLNYSDTGLHVCMVDGSHGYQYGATTIKNEALFSITQNHLAS